MSSRKKVVCGVLFVPALLALVFVGRETVHWYHYEQLEREGKLKASISGVQVPEVIHPGEMVACRATVDNQGSEMWKEGTHYFALGSFERDWLGQRRPSRMHLTRTDKQEEVKNGDRLKVPDDELPLIVGSMWVAQFFVKAQSEPGHYTTYLQMVKEGETWFGKTISFEITVVP